MSRRTIIAPTYFVVRILREVLVIASEGTRTAASGVEAQPPSRVNAMSLTARRTVLALALAACAPTAHPRAVSAPRTLYIPPLTITAPPPDSPEVRFEVDAAADGRQELVELIENEIW